MTRWWLFVLCTVGCGNGRDQSDILPPPGYVEPAPRPIVKQPPRAKRVRFGAGFYEREVAADGSSWRWMGGEGRITLPPLTSRGKLVIRGRAQLESPAARPTLKVESGGRVLETRTLDGAPFNVEALIEPNTFQGKPALDVVLTVSQTVTVPGDTRRLGLAVDHVSWDAVY